MYRNSVRSFIIAALFASAALAHAAQLSSDARTAIPRDVQQLVVIDYRAMQNSSTAMHLRDRVMPPDLKQFDEALRKSGLNENHDVDQLAFALFRPKESMRMWSRSGSHRANSTLQDILANFQKGQSSHRLSAPTGCTPWVRRGWCCAL